MSTSNWFLILSFFLLVGCSSIATKQEETKNTKNNYSKKNNWILGPQKPNTYFIDKTKSYGLENIRSIQNYLIDLNQDGWEDFVYLSDYFAEPKFRIFNPKSRKFEVPSYDVLPQVLKASFLLFLDYNKDGVWDILMATLNQRNGIQFYPPFLLKGKLSKGKISYSEDKTIKWNRALPLTSIGHLDFNLDGLSDLYFANWYDYKPPYKKLPDQLWKGTKESFENTSYALTGEGIFEKDYRGYPNAIPSYTVSTCDFDHNGVVDIMVGGSHYYPNKLWMGLAIAKEKILFKDFAKGTLFDQDEIGKNELTGGGHTLSLGCNDYNQDGHFDSFSGEFSQYFDQEKRDKSSVLTGYHSRRPPEFIRTEFSGFTNNLDANQAARRILWRDINADGRDDILIENSGFPPHSRLQYFEQSVDRSFDEKAKDMGIDILNPAGILTADLNRDGMQDLILGQTSLRIAGQKTHLRVFENALKTQSRILKLELKPKRSLKDGQGAMVILKTQRKLYKRWVDYTTGHLSGRSSSSHFFYVDKDDPVLYLKVIWPIRGDVFKPTVKKYMFSLKAKRTQVEIDERKVLKLKAF